MRVARLVVVAVLLALTLPSAALGWDNGPQAGAGFGTHDWILTTGNRMAVGHGTTWLDVAIAASATAEPDRIRNDQVNHAYDRWGKHYGNAQRRVSALYAQAVAMYRAGDRAGASRAVGLMSHYYADAAEPLHTDDSKAESKMHARFERSTDRMFRSANSYPKWMVYDGYERVTDPSAYTARAAKTAHGSYATLVKRYRSHGFDATAVSVARRAVVRAANGVSDLIMSIQQDAVEITASPNVSAHQGIAAGDGFFWVFHTNRITRYDGSWAVTNANTAPFAGLEGYFEPHLGDGCYYDGKLYVPAENWPHVSNQSILVFDATSLDLLASIPTSQTHEVASICVAPGSDGRDALWIASYLDSSRLFEYRLEDGAFVGERRLAPVPNKGIQGLTYHDNKFYISAGAYEGIGFLYSASLEGSTTLLYTRRSKGDHEGIEFLGDSLLWLIDRGSSGSKVRYLRLPQFLSAGR
jgi:hypothetical protein